MDINLTGTQPIETERLLLRAFISGDAQAMFSNWACDNDVTKYLSWNTHTGVNVSEAVVSGWVEANADPCKYHWAIVLKELGEPIGSISLMNFSTQHFKAEVGYCIGQRWWGQGIVTEALRAVIAYSFNVIGLNRVEAYHNVENAASGRVMQKAGMKHEGRFRQWKFKKGKFVDYDFYAILQEDFKYSSKPQ